jgi:hypothetical protein
VLFMMGPCKYNHLRVSVSVQKLSSASLSRRDVDFVHRPMQVLLSRIADHHFFFFAPARTAADSSKTQTIVNHKGNIKYGK